MLCSVQQTGVKATDGESPNWETLERVLGWKLKRSAALGTRAALWQIHWETREDREISTFYKRVGPQEFRWYQNLWHALPGYSPVPIYGGLPDDRSVLLPDLGHSFQQSMAGASVATQERSFKELGSWLADFHVEGLQWADQWNRQGMLPDYAIDSSKAWAGRALGAVEQLTQEGWSGLACRVVPLRDQARWIYQNLAVWTGAGLRTTVIHGDPHVGNIIESGGRPWLIDWEYLSRGIPARDITILIQDALDSSCRAAALDAWRERLSKAGFLVETPDFWRALQAVRFDNTLMMLGHEIGLYHQRQVSRLKLEEILSVKLGWLADAYAQLRTMA